MTTASLPPYIDPSQPPTKRSPWRQIRETPFVRTATLVMPEQVYQQVLSSPPAPARRYGRATLTLADILTGGGGGEEDGWRWTDAQLVMLSAGRAGVADSRMEIRGGRLRMELSKGTYEKCGLQGRPLAGQGGARRHVRARYEVEVDLLAEGRRKRRGPGLERVLWAARNVIDARGPMCWLVVAEERKEREEQGLGAHHVKKKTTWIDVEGETRAVLRGVRVPEKVACLVGEGEEEQECEDDWYEVVEWLDMVVLGSDGITEDHGQSDSSHSRYKVAVGEDSDVKAVDLRVVRWAGLFSHSWITTLLIEIVRRSKAANVASWLALSVASHRTEAVGQVDGYTVLLQSTQEEEGKTDDGFQQSRCFQFVDSND
ncbi:hypothetical protein DV735_g2721, partial [Chaetothyriales sp. CBS 134920]